MSKSYGDDIALMAHLMRRAGFSAGPEELERLTEQGYEETVDELINPSKNSPPADQNVMYRFMPSLETGGPNPTPGAANWLYHMVNTKRPLEEKMALFWHYVFATSNSKIDNGNHLIKQVDMLRENGMGNYRDLLLKIARNPAMIYWLDNNENHKKFPNENWGRELLELFSLGVGNYTEEDVFECARAFTGWTISAKIPRVPHHRFEWHHEFRQEEHDYGEKTFLGHKGNFDGEDIIDIILQQPACPRFVTRHLYNFFVEDEPQVPAWSVEPPRNPEAIDMLTKIFVESGFEIKPVLKAIFTSDFFKESMYKKVKSPVEVVVGTLRFTSDAYGPDPLIVGLSQQPGYMGLGLHDPPSVEGWHTGTEWINSGSLVKRINFVSDRLRDTDSPGMKQVIKRMSETNGTSMAPKEFVDRCLELAGPVKVSPETYSELTTHAEEDGEISWESGNGAFETSSRRVGDMMSLIASTVEYQFG